MATGPARGSSLVRPAISSLVVLALAGTLTGCGETPEARLAGADDPAGQFAELLEDEGIAAACDFVKELCEVLGGRACEIHQQHCPAGATADPAGGGGPTPDGGTEPATPDPKPGPAEPGRCFEPTFAHENANEWWREFSASSDVAAVQLEVQGGATFTMDHKFSKWVHGDGVSTPVGTMMRLLATSDTGANGATEWFAYLSEKPRAAACGATAPPPPGAGSSPPAPGPGSSPPAPGPGSSGGKTPVALHGKLSVSGNQIVDQSGKPVQLRGMSFGWSNWWGQYWTAQTVSWLVDDWGVELVRAAMGIEPGGAYLDQPTKERKKVTTVVDEAIARGIYVIIDWHDHNAPKNVNKAKAFFADMAAKYGDKPNVIFEIFNEPEGETWPQIKAYAAAVIPVIRANAPHNLIIVSTPNWSQDVDKAAADPIPGSNIAYSLHFYAATHKQWLRDKASGALAKGIALFVTEWGVSEASGSGKLDAAETDAWLKFMDANKLSWANWDIADKAGETCSTLMPNSSTTGGWPESSLTASGKLIRGKLRAYAGLAP